MCQRPGLPATSLPLPGVISRCSEQCSPGESTSRAGGAHLSVTPAPPASQGRCSITPWHSVWETPSSQCSGGHGEPASRLLVAQSPRDPRDPRILLQSREPLPAHHLYGPLLCSSVQHSGFKDQDLPAGHMLPPDPPSHRVSREAGRTPVLPSLLVTPQLPVLPLLCKSSSPQLSPYRDCPGHRTHLRLFLPKGRESCRIFLPTSTCQRSRLLPGPH